MGESKVYCVSQILEYFGTNMRAAPEVLGDPQRESVEELSDRYNRVIGSTLLSISAFIMLDASGRNHYLVTVHSCQEL